MLANENAATLRSLARLLRTDGARVSALAGSGLELLSLLESFPTTAIITGLRFPDVSGLEVLRRVAEITRRKTAALAYVSHADGRLVRETLDAGARAVVLQDSCPDNLLEALSAVAAGEVYVDPRLRPRIRRCA